MSNISDLDALMSDLESARRMGTLTASPHTGNLSSSASSGSRVYAPGTKVTHSFAVTENRVTMEDRTGHGEDERDRAGSPLVSRPKSPGTHRKLQPASQSPRQANNPSGATKELDDLMASLNDFKVVGDSSNTYSSETRTTSRFTDTTAHNYGSGSPARDFGDSSWTKSGPRASPLSDNNVREREQESQRTGGGSRASDGSDNNTCAACNRQVSGQVITALGKVWHIECFRCQHCDSPLRTQPFFEKSGKAYCEKDYYELFAMKCAKCKGAIKDTCFTALETTWHPECFCCSGCSTPFGENSFHERNGKPFCENCYLKAFAPQCAGCQRPISGTYLTALDAQWHRECFVCSECRKPFESGSFFDLDGRPYCEQHYHSARGSVCGTCQEPISGRCITAMGKKFHPDHFVCSYCVRPLNKGTFKEHANKPWCHNCFERLYGSKKDGSVGDEGADM